MKEEGTRKLTLCMIAYLLLRRRDATYNHPLATSAGQNQNYS